ncbi:MAG: hypothetical protein JSV09_08270 [Thermoplasmata archaeon]|nr:MAG: hypothetical protein JSV09_08270 [Thermoplasmata archaeon]
MKYYSEEETKDIRSAFEKEVLDWPEVSTKKMFGCPCYQADSKLFSFLVTKGVVITKLDEKERGAIDKKFPTEPFQAGKKTVQAWIRIPVENKTDLNKTMPFVKKSYKTALKDKK